ncbi:MAG: hypothetical protein HOP18_21330 [Deltaproteobacteria bacterium]|nr:hypothetical protein [Deltaproteobacteria bacterium]
MRTAKVFGIGLSRTGTTSLSEALGILGFSAVHYPATMRDIATHDAAADLPVADTFELLDTTFPGSKFIYTVRERTRWLESCRRHWTRKQGNKLSALHREFRERVYGTIDFSPALFAHAYDRHERRVMKYFAARPQDLLVLDICGGHANWETLCAFLAVPVPLTPFPNSNRVDAFEEIIIRLLHVTQNVDQVAKIAQVSIPYLESLQASDAFRRHDMQAPLSSNGNQKKVDGALNRARAYFGGTETTAERLALSSEFLADAVTRHRRRKRAKFFQEWQVTLRRLVTGSSGRFLPKAE